MEKTEKLTSCGLIAEFNPFHDGHKIYIQKAKALSKADVLVCVMSPNFVQRGEVAIKSKQTRIKDALDNGIDLVIELPTMFTVQAADIFASSSISILESLGCSNVIFGSESFSEFDDLKQIEDKFKECPRNDDLIKHFLKQGCSYPRACALANNIINNFYLENPNDILVSAYLKAIRKNKYKIKPLIYNRENNELDEESNSTSASSVRRKYKESNEANCNYLDNYFDLIKYLINTLSPSQLRSLFLVEEGIEYLFKKKITEATNLDEFINLCSSKRYSKARIKRTLVHILLNSNKKEVKKLLKKGVPYIRVLGMNSKGQDYLRQIKKTCNKKIITRFSAQDDPLLLSELRASDIYYRFDNSKHKNELKDFPIIVK